MTSHLKNEKLDRILLWIYDWFHDERTSTTTLTFIFQEPSSLLHCHLDKSRANYYRAEFRHVDRTDWRKEPVSKRMELTITDGHLYTILKTFASAYRHYHGQHNHMETRPADGTGHESDELRLSFLYA